MSLVFASLDEARGELGMMNSVPEVASFSRVLHDEVKRVLNGLAYVKVMDCNPVRRWWVLRGLKRRAVFLDALAGLVEERFRELYDEPLLPATRRTP